MEDRRTVTDFETGLRAWRAASGRCAEVALVANPSYVASPYELYPLADRNPGPFDAVVGIVKDMDGTTTTTEPLCLHSLEWMVRAITNRPDEKSWAGLDHAADHPHIIGNSTTKHVEYLLRTYGPYVQEASFRQAFVRAVLWTLAHGRDESREREVRADAAALGLQEMLRDSAFQQLVRDRVEPFSARDRSAEPLVTNYAGAVGLSSFADQVRAAVDIYYVRYHTILAAIKEGRAQDPAIGLGAWAGSTLVAPMPGVGVFLAIVKGWLGEQAEAFHEMLAAHVREKTGAPPSGRPGTLSAIGRWFAAHPARVAIVTSSIAYEADIVLDEVFRELRHEAASWPVAAEDRELIPGRFGDPRSFYDAFVTASDSSEIRLKPHRDLYSIALYRMGVDRNDYSRVVGFEDSESGVIAIRAAGVGCSVALPFAQSAGHDFRAATHVLPGQLPEVLLNQNAFLSPAALARSA
jgi:beta-phosphoglucomutase-like phosphatase (HAD superfamily)